MSRVLRELREWLDAALGATPGAVGVRLRALRLRSRLARVGARPSLETGVAISGAENISLGDGFAMGRGGSLHAENGLLRIGDRVSVNCAVMISASEGGEIVIGDDVLIGPNAVLRASDHRFSDKTKPIREQGHSGGRITVGADVWIGANAVVTAGVAIGDHAVVGAGAVVTRDVAPWSVVGGVPAREIAKR